MEWSNPATLGGQGLGTKLLGAGFATVMPRSGGFATLDVSQMTAESRLLTNLLMFIGGGSGSTAGGIRVTTFALLMLSIWRRSVATRRWRCSGAGSPTRPSGRRSGCWS